MKRTARNILLLVFAAAAGWGASEVLYRATWSRDLIGTVLGRGKLLAVVRGKAIHERDLFRGDAIAETMVMANALRQSAGQTETIAAEEVAREFDLLRFQFGDDERFAAALAAKRYFGGLVARFVGGSSGGASRGGRERRAEVGRNLGRMPEGFR